MCYNQTCLGFLFIAVIISFAGLIYFSLKSRKSFLEANLQLTADQIWSGVATRAANENLKKSDLIFGTWQDELPMKPVLVVKNIKNEIIGRVEFPLGSRELKILLGNEEYKVNFLLTRLRSAHLSATNNDHPIATYKTLNIFGKHKFDMSEFGTLISDRVVFKPRIIFNYRLGDNLVGTAQNISSRRQIGRLAILPSSIPLHIRVFILAL